MLPSSALLMLSGQGSAFILSFLVALQRCFCGFKNRKQTGPRSVLPAELSSWGCDKTALAAELIPLLPHSFQRPHFSTSLTTRRFCKLVIEDFCFNCGIKVTDCCCASRQPAEEQRHHHAPLHVPQVPKLRASSRAAQSPPAWIIRPFTNLAALQEPECLI